MPRDLGDVLHFFLPVEEPGAPAASERPAALERRPPVALPILTVPVATRDVVRAAFAWNLTVELARLGARAVLVAPCEASAAAPWPDPGRGPIGTDVIYAPAGDLASICGAAFDAAVSGAADAGDGGVVVACVPPDRLVGEKAARPLLRWMLLLGTPDPADLMEAYALAKLAYRKGSDPLVGLVIHGVRRMRDAEVAFGRFADAAVRHLGRSPLSYGLLADDLHVYRAIASRRPIGLEHPQSRAARALRDVARMLWEDAQKMTLV